MGFTKTASTYIARNLKLAKTVARTPAGASFLRWGMMGAGAGAIYGMADNVLGNDRVSVGQGAIRGAMYGMGGRALFGGFKGLKPATIGSKKSMYMSKSLVARPGAGSYRGGSGFTMSNPSRGLLGGPAPRAVSPQSLLGGPANVPLLQSMPNFTMVNSPRAINAARGRAPRSGINAAAVKQRYSRHTFGYGGSLY